MRTWACAFYRRVHLCPGLTVNLSRSGPSLSLGIRVERLCLTQDGHDKTTDLQSPVLGGRVQRPSMHVDERRQRLEGERAFGLTPADLTQPCVVIVDADVAPCDAQVAEAVTR
jgi:hypothetical protein